MLQTIGKIISVDLVKEELTIEVDKSQAHSIDGKDYLPIIYDSGKQAMIIELKKDDSKLTFKINYTGKKAIWNKIKQCIGSNVSFTPKTAITNPVTMINMNDLEKLIVS